MTTFGLVHGAWHGAWCWERLTPELERLGHHVVTVELPCDEPTATFTTYADVVVDALRSEPADLVLVAHSLAGLSAPIAAAQLPVSGLVFLCALIASPGRSLVDQLQDEPEMLIPGYDAGLGEPDEQGRQRWTDFDAARFAFYEDCDLATAKAAVDRLRPQAQAPVLEPCPLPALPDIRYAYVVGTEDRIVSPAWSRRAATARLGVEPIELEGSHSPFYSRPAELAEVLHSFGAGRRTT